MKFNELREWLSNKEHEQWMHWSKYVAEELKEIERHFVHGRANEVLRLLLIIQKKWEASWKPYSELSEDMKDRDRVWADKILDELPFKCPVYQCGGIMVARGEDSQTPDLVCTNCGAVYRFNGFEKKK